MEYEGKKKKKAAQCNSLLMKSLIEKTSLLKPGKVENIISGVVLL